MGKQKIELKLIAAKGFAHQGQAVDIESGRLKFSFSHQAVFECLLQQAGGFVLLWAAPLDRAGAIQGGTAVRLHFDFSQDRILGPKGLEAAELGIFSKC